MRNRDGSASGEAEECWLGGWSNTSSLDFKWRVGELNGTLVADGFTYWLPPVKRHYNSESALYYIGIAVNVELFEGRYNHGRWTDLLTPSSHRYAVCSLRPSQCPVG